MARLQDLSASYFPLDCSCVCCNFQFAGEWHRRPSRSDSDFLKARRQTRFGRLLDWGFSFKGWNLKTWDIRSEARNSFPRLLQLLTILGLENLAIAKPAELNECLVSKVADFEKPQWYTAAPAFMAEASIFLWNGERHRVSERICAARCA